MKMRSVSVLSVFCPTCTSFPACTKRGCGTFEARVVIPRQFILLCEALEFHILKSRYRICADYPKYDSVLFRQEARQNYFSNCLSVAAFSFIFSRTSIIALGMAVFACLFHHFDPDRSVSATIGWIAMKFYTDIHGPQRIQ